ncbi:MAG TPA: sel1 repeat family protein [Gammaproteobacteria bacterium]|nr:sel1 repeat family protein [Gammaproteobacteria bacterium]
MNNYTKTLADGLSAYEQRNYKQAAEIWAVLANQGDAEAQFSLGVMFKNGIGVPQNDTEAMSWLRKSADQNHEHAKLIVGVIDSDSGSEDNVPPIPQS